MIYGIYYILVCSHGLVRNLVIRNTSKYGKENWLHLVLCRRVNTKKCIARLPEDGSGANVTSWPARLHSLPSRLFSIKTDSDVSRKQLYRADSLYWNAIVDGYVSVFKINEVKIRNVMDMRAGYGG